MRSCGMFVDRSALAAWDDELIAGPIDHEGKDGALPVYTLQQPKLQAIFHLLTILRMNPHTATRRHHLDPSSDAIDINGSSKEE